MMRSRRTFEESEDVFEARLKQEAAMSPEEKAAEMRRLDRQAGKPLDWPEHMGGAEPDTFDFADDLPLVPDAGDRFPSDRYGMHRQLNQEEKA